MSRYRLSKSLVMVGMMGAGKTAVGTALARMLDVPFLDSDAEIESAANLSVAEIFENFGEPFFRDKETLVLGRLLEGEAKVLSTGGGAFLQARNRDLIAQKGLSVWLKVDRATLWSRVRHKDSRPLLRVANPQEKLYELLEAREPNYAKATFVVEAEANFSVQDMAEKVKNTLLASPLGVLQQVA